MANLQAPNGACAGFEASPTAPVVGYDLTPLRGFANCRLACQDTNADMVVDTCVLVKDATPGLKIDFSRMIHQFHYARKLEPWAFRDNIPYAGKFQINSSDFSEILLPMDVRNCVKCHADTANVCDAMKPCDYGQSCASGKCQNTAWQNPSTRVCTSCHTSSDAYAHTQIMTYNDPQLGAIESCKVCHEEGAIVSVRKAHNIGSPYVPPYPRTSE